MNYGEIKGEVLSTLARSDAIVTDKIGLWVNRRMRQAAARHNFDFMRAEPIENETTVNQQFYPIEGNPNMIEFSDGRFWKDEVAFWILKSNAYVPLPIKPRLWLQARFTPTDTGEPQYVSIESFNYGIPRTVFNFGVWPPKPDAVYNIRILGWVWPAPFSADADFNWLSERFPHMLIAGAVADGYWMLGAHGDAAEREAQFEKLLQEAIYTDGQRGLYDETVFDAQGIGVDYRPSESSTWAVEDE